MVGDVFVPLDVDVVTFQTVAIHTAFQVIHTYTGNLIHRCGVEWQCTCNCCEIYYRRGMVYRVGRRSFTWYNDLEIL